jgi:hypothetical protein
VPAPERREALEHAIIIVESLDRPYDGDAEIIHEFRAMLKEACRAALERIKERKA